MEIFSLSCLNSMLTLKLVNLILNSVIFTTAYVFCITLIEAGQAWLAHMWGDDTPTREGWRSYNPIDHIQLIDFVILLFVGLLWTRNVPLNKARLGEPLGGFRSFLIEWAPSFMGIGLATLVIMVLVPLFGIAPLHSSFMYFILSNQAYTAMVSLYPSMTSLAVLGTLFLTSCTFASLIIAAMSILSGIISYIAEKLDWGFLTDPHEKRFAIFIAIFIGCYYFSGPLRYFFLYVILNSITFIGHLIGVA